MNPLLTALGTRLAHYLATPKQQGALVATVAPQVLAATPRPGDVLLVEGNTRISRPMELSAQDLRHVLDPVRYLLPMPLPARLRRHLLARGGGGPLRAICSTLIAEASQALHYPVLPDITLPETGDEPS